MPRRAGTNARRLLSASLLALFAVVSADEASPASALDTLDWEDRGDAPVPDLPPRRASFPLRASPGDAPGEVRLAWTPPRTSRVFPGLGADDGKNENATDAVNLERFRARFEDASSLAAESRAYDVLVGACLNDAPTTTLNNYPYAPLPCASVVRERTSLGDEKKRNDERDKTSDVFFRRDASPRGVKGTSFVVTGLTPGAAYAFRVVTSDAPPDAEDADAVSGVAVARAAGGGEWLDYESAADVSQTPSLRFCGAVKDAFPNGTALLFSEEKRGASACCLACAETVGCNAWAHRGRTAGAAEDGSCWLMYAPPDSSSKTKKNASEEVDVLLKTPGWVGGVLDPSSADPPLTPSGVQLVDVSEPDGDFVDFDASAFAFDAYFPHESIERLRKVCVAWDPAPALPAPLAAERSAVQRYVIRTTSEFVKKSEDASDDDDDDEDDGEDWSSFATLEAERDADLPPLFCACDGWRVPEPTRRRVDRSNDDSDAPLSSEEDAVTITTRVVAENDAGRSSPASFAVTVPLLVARALAAATAETFLSDAESDEDSGTTVSSSCPSSSPRSMLAPPLGLRATRLADDAVFVDWSPPPFEVFAGEAEENESDLEEALSPRRLGYQVVWRAWDDTAASLLVAPPRAVTLADEEALERLAAPPCGEGEDEDASSEEPASCFSAPLATSLRLEGVPDADALLVGVRALTPSGPGPLSEPVVVRAEERGGRDAVGTDGVSDDDDADDDAAAESDSFEPAAKADTPSATLPAAPALTPPPLYESERVGAVYEQINRPQSQSTATNGGGVAAYDETTTTEEELLSSSQAPFAGVGAFDGYGGYPGFGYPFGMGALGLGGLGGYGGYRDRPAYYDNGFPYGEGNGTGGSVSVTTGATLVTLNVNLNGNGTVRESAARGDPTRPSPSPPPPPPSSPRPPPSVTSSPSPSPPPPASIGGLAAQQQKESAPRGASSRDPEAVDRIDDEEDAATVRVGGAVSSDERDSETADDSDDSDASSRRAAVVRLDDEEDAEEDSSAGESPNPLASTRLNENPPVELLDRDASDEIQVVLDDSAARRRIEAPLEDDASTSASTSARREREDSSSLGRKGGPADAREKERSEEEAKKRRVPTNRSSERAKRASALAATKRAEKASSARISAKNAAAAGRAATSRGAGNRQ